MVVSSVDLTVFWSVVVKADWMVVWKVATKAGKKVDLTVD